MRNRGRPFQGAGRSTVAATCAAESIVGDEAGCSKSHLASNRFAIASTILSPSVRDLRVRAALFMTLILRALRSGQHRRRD